MTDTTEPTLAAIEDAREMLTIAACFEDLDAAVRFCQERIGQTDGGIAAVYFSDYDDEGETWRKMQIEERVAALDGYLDLEKTYAEPEEGPAAAVA